VVGDGSFLVEEFINAITSQLDRVQDSLRVKAVNRPLTYALKDLTLELKVFVDMDAQGNVRFRTSGPNEAGSSVVHLGFTTITKPMIEENTISLASTRSTSLEELGLGAEDRQKLERVGVRNLAQLNRLGSSTGVQTIARLSDVSLDRLKHAIATGRPQVHTVQPEPPPKPPSTPKFPQQPPPRVGPVASPPRSPVSFPPRSPSSPVIRVAPGATKLNLRGANLMGEDGPVSVRLNNRLLEVADADNYGLAVHLPEEFESGALEVNLPDGNTVTYELSVTEADQWAPDGDRS
jgi:hypothetical protein